MEAASLTETIRIAKDGVQALIPKELYMAIIRLQADEGLSWEAACLRGAELSDSGSKQFKKKVEEEARKLHNSQLMQQLNRARASVRTSGYNAGYEAGSKAHHLWYYCTFCGEGIWLEPDSEAHKAVIQYMKDHGWAHRKCLEEQFQR